MTPSPVGVRTQQHASLFGVRIDLGDSDSILERIQQALVGRDRLVVTGPHFSILLQARNQEWLRAFLNGCHVNHPDGIGTVLGLRMAHGIRTRRVNGTDLYTLLLHRFPPSRTRYYFLGGDAVTARRLRETLAARWPENRDLDGCISHDDVDIKDPEASRRISAASPDILLVGMGAPRQFSWIARWQNELDVPVILAVGGGLEFLSGRRPRAPRWMRAIGLEWLHRVLLEPARLWRRYLLGIPLFLFFVLRERWRSRLPRLTAP